MPGWDCGFLWNMPLLYQALPTSWLGGSTRGLQPDGLVHKEAVHLLSLQPASITGSGAFKPECSDLSQFREDTGGPFMLSENLIS